MNEWFRQLESRIAFFILGGAILFLFSLPLAAQQMIHLGYEIEQLHQQKAELRRIHQTLLVEAESLSAIERVEQIAARQLKMSPILPEQRVYIRQTKDGRKLRKGREEERNDFQTLHPGERLVPGSSRNKRGEWLHCFWSLLF